MKNDWEGYGKTPMDQAGFAYLARIIPIPLGHAPVALAAFIAGWEACEKEHMRVALLLDELEEKAEREAEK